MLQTRHFEPLKFSGGRHQVRSPTFAADRYSRPQEPRRVCTFRCLCECLRRYASTSCTTEALIKTLRAIRCCLADSTVRPRIS